MRNQLPARRDLAPLATPRVGNSVHGSVFRAAADHGDFRASLAIKLAAKLRSSLELSRRRAPFRRWSLRARVVALTAGHRLVRGGRSFPGASPGSSPSAVASASDSVYVEEIAPLPSPQSLRRGVATCA